MAQGKTVYKVEWGPSKGTIYAAIGSIVASIYVPTWIQGPISCNFLLAFVCELLFCAAATLFFYDGQKRIAQMKVMATMLAFACGLGFLSNLFLQANFAIDNLLYSDGIVDTVINLCAVICTLTVYRMKPDTDATVSDTAEKSAPAYLKIKPLSVSISVAVVSLILMLNSNDLHMHSSYTANIPFFICAVIFLNVGSSFYLLRSLPSNMLKFKLGMLMLSLSLVLGTIGNTAHHFTRFRPGGRIDMSAAEFVIMNGGAILIVVSFFLWKRFVESETAKFIEAAAASGDDRQASAGSESAPANKTSKDDPSAKETAVASAKETER